MITSFKSKETEKIFCGEFARKLPGNRRKTNDSVKKPALPPVRSMAGLGQVHHSPFKTWSIFSFTELADQRQENI